jgi:electron transport complex protein RnfE
MKKAVSVFKNGIINENPTLVQLIGMCPTLAVTTSLANGIGMGIAATLVLICSNAVISLLRKYIPSKIRIAVFVVIIAGFVTMVDLSIQAFVPSLSKSLGIFIPLIVVNCIILARAGPSPPKTRALSMVDGFSMGLGFTLALIVLSTIREILGNGTLLGYPVFGPSFQPAMIMILPPGGFLTLSLVIAAIQKLRSKKGA